jgi:fatty acid desaturase
MADNTDKAGLLNLTIAEFNALRGEIKDRSATAYTLLNINITATTGIAGFVLSGNASPILLLILPLLSPALGLLFVDHSYNIDNLGSYIKSRLRPLAVAAAGDPSVLGYEDFIDAYEQKKLWRFLPLGLPLTLLFAGPPFAGLMFSWDQLKDGWAWALWIAGLLMFIAFVALWLKFLCSPYGDSKSVRKQSQ